MTRTLGESNDCSHLVLAAYAAWGHTKPLCSFAARLVKTRDVYVTLFMAPWFYDRVDEEVSRSFDEHEADARARLRLIALEATDEGFLEMDGFNPAFEKAYQALVRGQPLVCAKTAKEHGPVPNPDAVVLDFFGSKMLHAVRKLSPQPVKIYGWVVSCTGSYHLHIGMQSPNRNKDIRARIHEEAQKSGRSIREVAAEVCVPTANRYNSSQLDVQAFYSPKGRITNVPGVPPMFDYEEYPQKEMIPASEVGLFRMSNAEFTDNCDGMVIATPHCIEPPESLEAMLKYYEGDVHVVGPMLPVATKDYVTQKRPSDKAQEIDDFMTRTLELHGPNSLIYISFGSFWWSTEPEKIWAFLDLLLERKIPFIFSHASPFAQVPDGVREKVKNAGTGLFSPWSPQEYILSHPVTGWFVTHCGFNSLIESIALGVPMICWPYQADQPVNTMYLTENLGVAYELFEVRTGHGLKPICRNGKTPTGTLDAVRQEANQVLDQAFSEDGVGKRAKVKKLQESFAQAWEEQGPSQLALERFIDNIPTSDLVTVA
ncbi:hypothetical protein NM688_g3283 [Phlebia brevispora]|uniref:Uncharacterized protein n=1 Tax=Phlebia brevispora TaxID=194682 RepID=A0ACC1T647_9APHY|nr:hypothetical protein NM688_g3283 [Phlebia brevispora]